MLRQTIAELIVLFFCYSVAGWCMEVVLKYIQFHRFINRGFLIGPYCPIYGSGAVVVTVLVGGLIGNASYIVTFLASFVLCGVLEYFVSWYMEKMFHARWWDYSQKPMNLHGRIWIGNLVLFGIGGVAIVKLIDPVLMKWIHAIPQWILYTLSGAIVMLMIWDNIVSHIAFNLVKKEIDGVEADNSEEVSTKVRQLLREDPVLLRRIGEAYPNLEINSKKFAEKLKAQAEAVQESVEEKKQAVADAVAEGKLAAEAAAEAPGTLIPVCPAVHNTPAGTIPAGVFFISCAKIYNPLLVPLPQNPYDNRGTFIKRKRLPWQSIIPMPPDACPCPGGKS